MSEQRSQILAQGRLELTQLTQTEALTESLLHVDLDAYDILHVAQFDRTTEGVQSLLSSALPLNSKQDNPNLEAQMKTLTHMFFSLGEKMTPFYAGFADWVHIMVKNREYTGEFTNPVCIFHGRDALGFMRAFAHRHTDVPWVYSPVGRSMYWDEYNSTQKLHAKSVEPKKQRILEFMDRRKLAGKDLVYVDFGFNGTLPRFEHAVFIEKKYPFSSCTVLLAEYLKHGDSIFTNGRINPSLITKRNRTQIIEADRSVPIYGYLNGFLGESYTIDSFERVQEPNGGVAYVADFNFQILLQELASYVRESRSDSLISVSSRGLHDLSFRSAHVLAAKYAFMNGLGSMLPDTQDVDRPLITSRLNALYALYKQQSEIFGLLSDANLVRNMRNDMNDVIVRTNETLSSQGELRSFS